MRFSPAIHSSRTNMSTLVLVRHRRLDLPALYQPRDEYHYTNGFNVVSLVALVLAVLPNLPGFLVNVKLLEPSAVPPFLIGLYSYAWFVGFGIAFFVYIALRRCDPSAGITQITKDLAIPRAGF